MRRFARSLPVWLAVLLVSLTAWGARAEVRVLWLGQSAFRIVSPAGKIIVIDPWLTGNPATPVAYRAPAALGHVDLVLVTHAHRDHLGDAPALASMHQARLYGPGDMNQALVAFGVLPAALAPRFNKGGTVEALPGIRITATHAEHSSLLLWHNPVTGKDEPHYGGEPIGFLIELENGFRIYHMGDTDLFGDLALIARRYRPDLVLAPIGGHFTMGPEDAAWAMREMLRPRFVVPMHYGTNPLLNGTPEAFRAALAGSGIDVRIPAPGEEILF